MNLQKNIALAALTSIFALLGPDRAQAETTGEDLDPRVYITSPAADAYFEDAPVTLDVQISVQQGDGEWIESVSLTVDGVFVDSLDCWDDCTFVGIELEQGVHELVADGGFAADAATIYVGEAPPSETGEEDTAEEDTGEDTGEESGGDSEDDSSDTPMDDEHEIDDESGGAADDMDLSRGCSVDGAPSTWGLLALPILLLLPAWRRRDRD